VVWHQAEKNLLHFKIAYVGHDAVAFVEKLAATPANNATGTSHGNAHGVATLYTCISPAPISQLDGKSVAIHITATEVRADVKSAVAAADTDHADALVVLLDGDRRTLTWPLGNQVLLAEVQLRAASLGRPWQDSIVLLQVSQQSPGAVPLLEMKELLGEAARTWLPFNAQSVLGLFDGLKGVVKELFLAQRAGGLVSFVPGK
jgi:hypothetical protein